MTSRSISALAPSPDEARVSRHAYATAAAGGGHDSRRRGVIHTHPWDSFPDLGEPCHLRAGAELFREAEAVHDVFFLISGFVKLLVHSGRDVITGLATEESVLGGEAVLVKSRHCATAVAVTPCVVKRASAAIFRRLLDTDVDFARRVREAQSRDAIRNLRMIAELKTIPAEQRLGRLLREFFLLQRTHEQAPNGRLSLPLNFRELADLLAVTPQYLSSLVTRLQIAGALRRENGWLVVERLDLLPVPRAND